MENVKQIKKQIEEVKIDQEKVISDKVEEKEDINVKIKEEAEAENYYNNNQNMKKNKKDKDEEEKSCMDLIKKFCLKYWLYFVVGIVCFALGILLGLLF